MVLHIFDGSNLTSVALCAKGYIDSDFTIESVFFFLVIKMGILIVYVCVRVRTFV